MKIVSDLRKFNSIFQGHFSRLIITTAGESSKAALYPIITFKAPDGETTGVFHLVVTQQKGLKYHSFQNKASLNHFNHSSKMD